MSEALGVVNAALTYGLESILIKPQRSIGALIAQVTVSETHHDDLEITDHPVEQGASITDHAFKRPAEVVIRAMWSNSPSIPGFVDGVINAVTQTIDGVQSLITGNNVSQVKEIYQKLLDLQNNREPFDVVTGKRKYTNMLVKSLTVTTERGTENVLDVTATLRQVIIVTTQTLVISAPAADQSDPASTQPTLNKGTKQLVPATNYNPQAGP
jgi:hypothetical protein